MLLHIYSNRFLHYHMAKVVSYIITWQRWFRVYFLHAKNFSLSTKSNLMHIVPRSEDDFVANFKR